MISVDIESRARVNLLTEGSWNYATDPDTEIICMSYAVDYGEVFSWLPGDPVPEVFHMEHTLHAWNADGFERPMWDFIMTPDHGFPPVALEQWRCTAFKSRCNNLPNALGNAARCLGVVDQKDTAGKGLIKLLCVPMEDGSFCKDPKLLQEMAEYCSQDVRAEMGVDQLLREPSEAEWRDFHVNARINERGIRIDRTIAEGAQAYAAEEEAELLERITELTDGVVVKARGEKLKAWVVERLTPEQEKLLVKHRGGERMLSLDKSNRYRLLALEDIDPTVREVVECSDFAQKSSVSKFKAMSLRADPDDDRVRGALLCNGASATGRASSRGLQVHNFPRDCMDNPLDVRQDFIDDIEPQDMVDWYEKPVMTILSHMLRPALIPAPGHTFLVSDWSAIEGRVAPWLCGKNKSAAAKLRLYADDEPVYEITAAATFRCDVGDVTKAQRQVGKVQELSFQYQGGKTAFQAMARNYGLVATDDEAEGYKDAWRASNLWASGKQTGMWARIEKAARAAVRSPTQQFVVGRLTYIAVPDVLCGGLTLFCELPCGRYLTYPDVRIEPVETPWGDMQPQLTCLRASFLPKATEKEWPRTSIYGGLLFENAVQGTAASLLRDAVSECGEDWGFDDNVPLPVVFHVHDEIVLEVPDADVEDASADLSDIMNSGFAWTKGLPLAADVDVMSRYGK